MEYFSEFIKNSMNIHYFTNEDDSDIEHDGGVYRKYEDYHLWKHIY